MKSTWDVVSDTLFLKYRESEMWNCSDLGKVTLPSQEQSEVIPTVGKRSK